MPLLDIYLIPGDYREFSGETDFPSPSSDSRDELLPITFNGDSYYLGPQDRTKDPQLGIKLAFLRQDQFHYSDQVKYNLTAAGWSSSQQYFFLHALSVLPNAYNSFVGFAHELPILTSLVSQITWKPDQHTHLWLTLAKRSQGCVWLSYTMNIVRKMRGTDQEKYQLLVFLAETSKEPHKTFPGLAEAISALSRRGLSFNQQAQLLILLNQKARDIEETYFHLPKALKALSKTGWNFNQKARLLILLAQQAHSIKGAYENLDIALSEAKKMGLPYEQTVCFIVNHKLGSYPRDDDWQKKPWPNRKAQHETDFTPEEKLFMKGKFADFTFEVGEKQYQRISGGNVVRSTPTPRLRFPRTFQTSQRGHRREGGTSSHLAPSAVVIGGMQFTGVIADAFALNSTFASVI